VDIAHHDFGLGGVGHPGQASGLFDLVDDPVPIPDAFEGDGSAFRELGEVIADGAAHVVDALLLPKLTGLIHDSEERIVFVGIATYAIMGHGCTSCCLRARGSRLCDEDSRGCGAFIQSSR